MPVASAARELTPLPDDAGLRTVLRNVPLLPAPANVDDLVARLDAEEVPVSSGPLAELISDARYIEPASNATQSDEANDRFFAPVSRAVNTNRRPPLAPRLLSGLFNAALLAGALLILWNALLAPDGAPPPVTPMKTAESATASDLTKAPALTVAADEPSRRPGQTTLCLPKRPRRRSSRSNRIGLSHPWMRWPCPNPNSSRSPQRRIRLWKRRRIRRGECS